MICALKSSVFRYVKTGLLAKSLLFSFAMGLGIIFHTCLIDLYMFSFSRPRFLDNGFVILNINKLIYVVPFASALFCMILTGSDISYRSINNKIATGISKTKNYLAELAVSIFATVLSVLIAGLEFIIYSKTVPYKNNVIPDQMLIYAFIRVIIICVSFTTVYLLIQFFFSKKLFGLIISLLLVPALMSASSALITSLSEPYRSYVLIDAENETYEWHENPAYVGGIKRKVLQNVYESIPYRDDYLYEKYDHDSETTAAGAVILLSTAAGIMSVSRKELP